MSGQKTWYLAWPDRVEPIEMDFSRVPTVEEFTARHGSRGPFPRPEQAEEARWRDDLVSYWEHGLTVWADHCLGCGLFAKVLAFDSSGEGWSWRVTECKKCGVLDSRLTTKTGRTSPWTSD